MPHSPAALFELSRSALHTTQSGLGERLGVSRRTAQRWAQSGVPSHDLPKLVHLVHPHDADLARHIAASMGTTLEAMGLVRPPPPPVPEVAPPPPPPAPPLPPPPPPSPPDGVVDAVVCAAAEAMDMMPRDVRAGLHAAFARASEIGVTVAMVERVLRPKTASAEAVGPPPDLPPASGGGVETRAASPRRRGGS
jgi:hypothetical protein